MEQKYTCIMCNFSKQPSPMSPCAQCGSEKVDAYYSYDRVILTLDLLLCRVSAYRHILKNRIYNIPRKNYFLWTFLIFQLLVIVELLYHQKERLFNSSPIDYGQLLEQVMRISFMLGFEIFSLFCCIIVFQNRQIRKQNILYSHILFGLCICQYPRLSNILFIIWDHSHFFKLLGTFSIKLAELSAVRAIVEDQQKWILSTAVLIVFSYIQTLITGTIGMVEIL